MSVHFIIGKPAVQKAASPRIQRGIAVRGLRDVPGPVRKQGCCRSGSEALDHAGPDSADDKTAALFSRRPVPALCGYTGQPTR